MAEIPELSRYLCYESLGTIFPRCPFDLASCKAEARRLRAYSDIEGSRSMLHNDKAPLTFSIGGSNFTARSISQQIGPTAHGFTVLSLRFSFLLHFTRIKPTIAPHGKGTPVRFFDRSILFHGRDAFSGFQAFSMCLRIICGMGRLFPLVLYTPVCPPT